MKTFVVVTLCMVLTGAAPVMKSKTIVMASKSQVRKLMPIQQGLDSLPDPLDGSTLPDDLFGGQQDPRSGGRRGNGNGNTAFYRW